jgi:hypothetical protein
MDAGVPATRDDGFTVSLASGKVETLPGAGAVEVPRPKPGAKKK